MKKDMCHRCGLESHWYEVCKICKHFVCLYQDSLKGKKYKEDETNFTNNSIESNLADNV